MRSAGKAICAGLLLLLAAAGLLITGPAATVYGKEGCDSEACIKCHTLSLKEANDLLREVGEVKGVKVPSIKGLFEVDLQRDGRQATVYIDYGKHFLIAGQIFSLATKEPVSQPLKTAKPFVRKIDPARIPLDNSVVLGNPKGTKKLFVFTDPDCPYCQNLHGELKRVIGMEPDLAVYVKMYPLDSHAGAYSKARVILGAGLKAAEMLDRAFAGNRLPEPGPNDPKGAVDETIRFGESVGIRAVPTLIFPDGTMSTGVKDVATIRTMLQENGK